MTGPKQEEEIREHADAYRSVSGRDGDSAAGCALWWRNTPEYGDHKIGLIGHYSATDDQSAEKLLASVCTELRDRGCTLAVGPMNGSTWHSYRFVTEKGSEAPFAAEPENPESWPEQFRRFGFHTMATYTSSLTETLSAEDPGLLRARRHFAEKGFRIRTLESNPDCFETEMRRIFRIALISFKDNFLFHPIGEEDFLNLYRPIQSYIDPHLVFIAEMDGEAVGFLLMTPDFRQATHGARPDTAVLKTVAVLPETANAGLGAFLVRHSHAEARRLGYRRVIHALMHDTNASMNISRKTATPIRRYALFAKVL